LAGYATAKRTDYHLHPFYSRGSRRSIRVARDQHCPDYAYDLAGTEDCGSVVSLRGERELRDIIKSAEDAGEVQDRMKGGDGWVLVQAMQGKRPVVHTMIDAGMTRRKAEDLNLAKQGVKLVFSRPKGGLAQEQPFGTSARWQPAFIAEMNDGKVSHVITLDQHVFIGNPVMPVF
jgi:hypothetical protein